MNTKEKSLGNTPRDGGPSKSNKRARARRVKRREEQRQQAQQDSQMQQKVGMVNV